MTTVILKKSDLTGELKEFPIEVVKRMLIEQHLQGNVPNVNVFKSNMSTNLIDGGFEWDKTDKGYSFWLDVLILKNFRLFFKAYPERINPDEIRLDFEEREDNKPINLAEILKDCPKGTRLYSVVHGDCILKHVKDDNIVVTFTDKSSFEFSWEFTFDGRLDNSFLGECVLFPAKDQRDWSKFSPDLSKGTPVMCSNGNDWVARIYAEDGKTFIGPRSEGNLREWSFIIPVKDFDFQDLNANKTKKNYGK